LFGSGANFVKYAYNIDMLVQRRKSVYILLMFSGIRPQPLTQFRYGWLHLCLQLVPAFRVSTKLSAKKMTRFIPLKTGVSCCPSKKSFLNRFITTRRSWLRSFRVSLHIACKPRSPNHTAAPRMPQRCHILLLLSQKLHSHSQLRLRAKVMGLVNMYHAFMPRKAVGLTCHDEQPPSKAHQC